MASAPFYSLLYFFVPIHHTTFFRSHWLLSHHHRNNGHQCTSVKGMNPVAMTIIKPQEEYWPSWGSHPPSPVLKSYVLLSYMGLAWEKEKMPVILVIAFFFCDIIYCLTLNLICQFRLFQIRTK